MDLGFVARGVWYGVVGVLIVGCVLFTPWGAQFAGADFHRYLAGGRALIETGDPYSGTFYLYSPAFALIVAPLNALPPPLALNVWRVAELAALAWAIRGAGTAALLVFAMPFLWIGELLVGNMMGFATAAMIAVIVRPNLWTVTLYAVLLALVPKPALLPVMAYGFVVVPEARRWVVVIGAFGLAMLLWPGYLAAVRGGPDNMAAYWAQPFAVITAAALAVLGFRWPRLFGVSAVFASPYVFLYHFTTLGTLFVQPARVRWRSEAGVRRGFRPVVQGSPLPPSRLASNGDPLETVGGG